MSAVMRRKQWDWESQYADLDHPEWLNQPVPRRFWNDPENHRRYAMWLGRRLGVKKLDDWYGVSSQDFRDNRGSSVLDHYGGSTYRFLCAVFDQHDWKPWLFKLVPHGFWQKRENRIWYLRWLEKQLGYRKPEDWYAVTSADFRAHGGANLIDKICGGLKPAIKELYPKHQWHEWKFGTVPSGFWQNKENRQKYLKWLEHQLGICTPTDWYRVTYSQIDSHRGKSILEKFDYSMMAMLKEAYPTINWLPWRFATLPDFFWRQRKNRLRYMTWLGKRLGYRKHDDWYSITQKTFTENDGKSFFKFFKMSPSRAVIDSFPQHQWLPWKFKVAPNGFWTKRKNRVHYMTWLGEQLGYRNWEDWYAVSKREFDANDGSSLLQMFGGAPSRVVMETFRDYQWLPWRFHKTLRGFWQARNNRLRYMNWLGKQLGFRRKDDWNNLSAKHFYRNYGETLLARYYHYSIPRALQDYRPHFKWDQDPNGKA